MKAEVFGRYLLGPRIARGGMGEVFHATQLGLGQFAKPLVLKLLLPHLAEDGHAVDMFLEEARFAARMNHPNVVSILDVGVEKGRYFIAMELVRGAALSVLLDGLRASGGKLSPGALAYLGRCLAEALHHAHEQKDETGKPLGLVHRDVSPQNMLVSIDGAVKLTDFGIAKAQDSASKTNPGFVRGKVEYLAPEQLLLQAIDRRVDVFAAGVTLFHAATLTSPFRSNESHTMTARAVVETPLPSLAALRPDLPPELVAAVEKACAKSADARFATARELRDALPTPPGGAGDELAVLLAKVAPQVVNVLEQASRQTMAWASTPEFSMEISIDEPTATDAVNARATPAAPKGRLPRVGVWVLAASLLLLVTVGVTAVALQSPPVVVPPPPVSVAEPVSEPEVVVAPTPEPPVTAPAPRPPRPAPAPGVGRITIVSTQGWGWVRIDGKKIGETPIADRPIASGTVTVQIENPKNGKSVKRVVKIENGKRAYVKVDLP